MLKPEHIKRSDNLRVIPDGDRKQVAAFMELMQGIENGTAVVRVFPGDGYVAAPHRDPQVGDIAAYKAIAGDVYDAVVTAIRAPGLVDIDIVIPGVTQPMRLTKVKYVMETNR